MTGPAGTIASARVTVASPSQTETTTTDSHGNFAFASLAPDDYTVSVQKEGFESLVLRGVHVTADQARTVAPVLQKQLRQLAIVSTNASGLARAGTTRDLYSISPAVAEAAGAIGAGRDSENAYSAIATVPGVYIPFGQQGAEQTIYIRGGDSTEVGYEYDGVPVNRAFDSAPAHTLSNLGQQELQVYTNGGADGASATGIAGFINQVIRTGTYPGFADAKLTIGSPTYDHSLTAEVGGATPDRRFSYYAGLSGYNQDYRYIDQFNGTDQPIFQIGSPSYETETSASYRGVVPTCTGASGVVDPFGGGPPAPGAQNGIGCFSTLSTPFTLVSDIADREGVINLHYGIPHRFDGGKDDIQVLYSSSYQLQHTYSSPDDAGPAFLSALIGGPATWPDALTWPAGTKFGQSEQGLVAVPFFDPSSPAHVPNSPLPLDHRDSQNFDDAILKVQYQKNLGSSAYVRLFLYSFYSGWSINGPIAYATDGALPSNELYDYDLNAHERGAELKTAFTLGSKHFVSATFNGSTATTSRFNNQDYLNGPTSAATNLTDGTHCYAWESGTVSGVAYAAGDVAPCNSRLTSGTFAEPTQGDAPAVGAAAAAGASWRVTYAGDRGFYNAVQPFFSSATISDLFRPNQQVQIEGAIRFDRFDYRLPDTSGPGRAFWFTAAQQDFCYDPVTGAPVLGQAVPPPLGFIATPNPYVGVNCPVYSASGAPIQTVHPDGLDGHLLLSNSYDHDESSSVIEPRIGLTFEPSPDTVLRASYGRYAQGPLGGNVQYDTRQANLASQVFLSFWPYGFTTPRHDSDALTSDDIDLSYERHFRGTDSSIKITPYYRTASNQHYSVFSGFGLGTNLNSGFQQDSGIEVEFTKGDFKNEGLSFLLSYAYLNSRERFANYPGTTQNPLDPYNAIVTAYNALTKAGGGAPCYANSADGTPDPNCGPTSIRNPYYDRPAQPLYGRNSWYPTNLDYPYLSPHTLTALVNYRHRRFTVTPSVQITAGPQYGNPADVLGLDPRGCTNNSAGFTGSAISKIDPLQADYTSCGLSLVSGGSLDIPNPLTGTFDTFGQFSQPWHVGLNAALGYDISSKIHATLSLTNLFDRCFGGSRTPWSAMNPPNSSVCSYQANAFYVSNFYNGTSPNDIGANGVPLNPHFALPFKPSFSDPSLTNFAVPFNAYLQLSVRL